MYTPVIKFALQRTTLKWSLAVTMQSISGLTIRFRAFFVLARFNLSVPNFPLGKSCFPVQAPLVPPSEIL